MITINGKTFKGDSISISNNKVTIDGNEIIIMFDIKPGRQVGFLKNSIKEAIMDGIIPNEYEAARDFLIKKAAEMGLKPAGK